MNERRAASALQTPIAYATAAASFPLSFSVSVFSTASWTSVEDAISLIFFSRRCMSCTLFSQTSRASGSLISSASFTRPGSSFGRKGAASRASSTSLLMLQMMSAAWRFRAVALGPRSPNARDSSGTTTARVGESTLWTNVVAANAWTVASTSLGFEALDTSLGMTGSTSRLPERPKAAVTAAFAAAFTSFFVSQSEGVSSGTRVGRHAAVCLGAVEQSWATRSSAATRQGHCFSTPIAP
mmetsp:Transcript_7992/g.22468  ORF Transcript_7992/g.22468 Transcript_7992/m.22468 type:complete len:240 (-) Transcript_7992:403-1122(-)